jgi:hypothetical protein
MREIVSMCDVSATYFRILRGSVIINARFEVSSADFGCCGMLDGKGWCLGTDGAIF